MLILVIRANFSSAVTNYRTLYTGSTNIDLNQTLKRTLGPCTFDLFSRFVGYAFSYFWNHSKKVLNMVYQCQWILRMSICVIFPVIFTLRGARYLLNLLIQERRLSRKFNGGLGDYPEMWEEFNVAMCKKIEGYIPHWEGRLLHSQSYDEKFRHCGIAAEKTRLMKEKKAARSLQRWLKKCSCI